MNYDFLLDFALILTITKILGLFTRRIHLPQVVGMLLAGILLGPAVLDIIQPYEVIETLAQVGVVLLMFTAGLETDLSRIRKALKPSLIVAVIGVLVPLGGGYVLASCFGQDTMKSIFMGVILTATSVSITVETLREMGKLNTRVGSTIMGAAVIDDILGLVILSSIMGLGGSGAEGGSTQAALIGVTLLKIFGFFVFSLLCGIGMNALIKFLNAKFGTKHRIPVLALAFCFFLSYVAERFGVAEIIGAFFAGLALCNNDAEKYIEEQNSVLSYMFFSPIFFVSIGLMTTFDGLDSSVILFAVLLLAVAIITKLVGCGVGALLCKIPKRESFQIGVGMVSRGEVAIIVAAKGVAVGLMDSELFSSVILVVITTTLVTPILLKLVFSRGSPQEGISQEEN
ncbi:MAG: cation:proton antiporter [Oscillospiraceae bacterium]|nr:cation:proton antiporter [Oscillospiraceae bacterium]